MSWSARRLFSSFLPRSVVITAARRSPIGSFRGALSQLSAVQLGAFAIKETVAQSGLKPEEVSEVVMGNVIQAGNKQSPTRQAVIKAGLPHKTVCTTVHKACASGMKAITMAAQGIALGTEEVAVAGGFESLTNVPFLLLNYRAGHQMLNTHIMDSLFYDGLTCSITNLTMGVLAEKTNEKYSITRAMQDEYAIRSYRRTAEAWARGFYRQEVAPITIEGGKQGPVTVAEDEEYKKVKYEKIPSLQPSFLEVKGTITAANASKINDGAAALVLMSEEKAREKGIQPLARIISFADAETEPTHFQMAPSMAIEKALSYVSLSKEKVDLFEINEAFSSAALVNMQLLSINIDRVNVNGGAVALGHPVGCSGARITGTLAYTMRERRAKYGVAAICNGGGGATAVVLELV